MDNETMNQVTDQEQNQTPAEGQVKRIQKTVFDLSKFDNIILYKDVEQPKKPADLKEAQQLVGGSTEALLNLIYTGLVAKANEDAQKEMSGFCLPGKDSDGKEVDYPLDMKNALGDPYTGQFADGEKKTMINAAILSMSKMMGYAKGNDPKVNEAAQKQAMDIIRANPVMLKSLQG